jgi:hypothetical protein
MSMVETAIETSSIHMHSIDRQERVRGNSK